MLNIQESKIADAAWNVEKLACEASELLVKISMTIDYERNTDEEFYRRQYIAAKANGRAKRRMDAWLSMRKF